MSSCDNIDDNICPILAHLFSQRSTIKHLILDETSLTEVGVSKIIESIAQNLKVHTLSFRHCKVTIADQEDYEEWHTITNVMK